MDIQTLVNKGYKQAAFKYKRNAQAFIGAWTKKGYKDCGWMFSSGPVVDVEGQPYVQDAYYCICSKDAPKPLTAKQEKVYAEFERNDKLAKEDPLKFWNTVIKPKVLKDIDPEIRDLIVDLNNNHQFTIESCAGHGKNDHGRLFFDGRKLDGWKVREIMTKHGLTGIQKRERYLKDRKFPIVVYEFNPIGKVK